MSKLGAVLIVCGLFLIPSAYWLGSSWAADRDQTTRVVTASDIGFESWFDGSLRFTTDRFLAFSYWVDGDAPIVKLKSSASLNEYMQALRLMGLCSFRLLARELGRPYVYSYTPPIEQRKKDEALAIFLPTEKERAGLSDARLAQATLALSPSYPRDVEYLCTKFPAELEKARAKH